MGDRRDSMRTKDKVFEAWELGAEYPLSAYFNEGAENEIEEILLRDGIYESKLITGVVYLDTLVTRSTIERIEKNWATWKTIPVYMYNLEHKTVRKVKDANTCPLGIENDIRLIKKVLGGSSRCIS